MGARPSIKFALAVSGILAVTAVAFFVQCFGQISSSLLAESEDRLRTDVMLLQDGLGAELETPETKAIQARTTITGRALGIRIALIRADGTVLADSEGNPERMDNLASRPEVVSALSQEFGFCRRMSPTLGVDSLFVAKAIRRGDHFSGWIRASETAESVTARLRAIERSTLTAAAIASIVAAVLGALWMNVRLQRGAAGTD